MRPAFRISAAHRYMVSVMPLLPTVARVVVVFCPRRRQRDGGQDQSQECGAHQ